MARFVDVRDDFMGARLFAGSALAPVCSSHPFSWLEEIRRSRHEKCVRDRASFLVYLVGGAEGETNGKGPVYLSAGLFGFFRCSNQINQTQRYCANPGEAMTSAPVNWL